jgi:hypothetical protein
MQIGVFFFERCCFAQNFLYPIGVFVVIDIVKEIMKPAIKSAFHCVFRICLK